MLNRRIFVCSGTIALAALVQGCDASRPRPRASGTWRGRWIEVYASEGVSLNSGPDQAEVEVGRHRIVIREAAITVDDVTKVAPAFTRVSIDVTSGAVIVTLDGTPLFT